jgi:quercetin dioxygenase-like cupin family protein
MHADIHEWTKLPIDRPMPRLARQRVIGKHVMISRVRLERGFELGSHRHENEQMVVLLAGRCSFGLGEPGSSAHREVELRAGQVLHLLPNLPHSCRCLEDAEILDLFSPPSEKTGVDGG